MRVEMLFKPFSIFQFDKRFKFTFFIAQSVDPQCVSGRVEIFEYSTHLATLSEACSDMTRVELAEALLARCGSWVAMRIQPKATLGNQGFGSNDPRFNGLE